MRNVYATCSSIPQRRIMRVAAIGGLPSEWRPGLSFLIPVHDENDIETVQRLVDSGLRDLFILERGTGLGPITSLPIVRCDDDAPIAGDVVAVTPGRSKLQVLYRERDDHHTVFLTNRCNSRCIMCSQPPTPNDDSWLVDEAVQVARHIRRSPNVIGFTGGEPLLLGSALREVLDVFAGEHPTTQFQVLTNGREFNRRPLAKALLDKLTTRISWAVPLYGHADFLHDQVVNAEGAFDQTIDGLLTLHEFKQPIQLRTVLIKPVLEILPELCAFIARNLPFVREVALMGCEPIGYARAHRDLCEVNLAEWGITLQRAVGVLNRAGLPSLLMNAPLCAIPVELHQYAHRSISDWKQSYAPECAPCDRRSECSGVFASAEKAWKPGVLHPFSGVT